MEDSHFDHLVRSLAGPSRRAVVSALTTTLFGGAHGLHSLLDAEAKKGKKSNHRGHQGRDDKSRRHDDRRKDESKRHDHPRKDEPKRHDHTRKAESDAVRADAKKPCPPCKKRKAGKCKKKMPDGAACPGGTCQSGRCDTTSFRQSECTALDRCAAPPASFRCAEATCVNGDCGFGPRPAGTVCRAASGECDVDDVCDGASLDCPADALKPSGTACTLASGDRGSCLNGDCVAECTTPATCPPPSPNDLCAEAACSGSKCEFRPKPAGTLCRAASGECDVPAVCDGDSLICPPNRGKNYGTPCTSDGNPCRDHICDGTGKCFHPVKPFGTACPDDGNICTEDICNGAGACIPRQKKEGTTCGQNQKCCNGTCCAEGQGCKDGTTCCQSFMQECEVWEDCCNGFCGPVPLLGFRCVIG
jgi:hypothetical protein